MIANSTYELALKYPECVNLHTEFHGDLFWDRPYLMCTSTICLESQIIAPCYVDDSKLHRAARQITEDLKKVVSLVLAEYPSNQPR